MTSAALDNDLLLRAARGERTERTPVWLMRQAGRYDPEYQRIRAASGLDLEDLFCRPDYAAEITVLPLRLGVDAAILYQDILTPLGPLGAPFIFRPGSNGAHVRAFVEQHPEALHRLLDLLAQMTGEYLRMQIDAGAHVVQLFESCANLLSSDEYETFALPYQQRIFEHIGDIVPRIIFAKDLLDPDMLRQSGADVLSISDRVDLATTGRSMPESVAVQGNVDNQLLLNGPPEAIERAVKACLRAGGRRGHILNLGHGILKGTPFEHVQCFLNAARQHNAENAG